MVVNMVWVQSWSIVFISLSVLIFAVLLLLCCVCWERKDSGEHHLYVLDENGMKIVNSSLETEGSFFRRFSNPTNLGRFNKFGGNLMDKYRNNIEDEAVKDLVDSFDVEKQFDNTTLKFEFNERYCLGTKFHETFTRSLPVQNINETFTQSIQELDANETFTLEEKEDLDLEDENVSSTTESSRTTFYSIYPPYMRTTSVPETMRSALSYCDINSLEE